MDNVPNYLVGCVIQKRYQHLLLLSFLSDNNEEDAIGYRRLDSQSSHSLESEDEYQVESERVSQSIRL